MKTTNEGPGFGRREAEYMLWLFSLGGPEPGDYTKYLLEAVARADRANLVKLAVVYPEIVTAFEFFHAHPVSATQAIANPANIRRRPTWPE